VVEVEQLVKELAQLVLLDYQEDQEEEVEQLQHLNQVEAEIHLQ
jgi:hypothetical protein